MSQDEAAVWRVNNELAAMRDRNCRAENQNRAIAAQISELDLRLEKEVEQAQSVSARMERVDSAMRSFYEHIKDFRAKLSHLSNCVQQRGLELDTYREEDRLKSAALKYMKNRVESQQNFAEELNEGKCVDEALTTDIASWNARLRDEQKEFAARSSALEALRRSLLSAKEELAEALRDCGLASTERTEADEGLRRAEEELETLRSKLNEARSITKEREDHLSAFLTECECTAQSIEKVQRAIQESSSRIAKEELHVESESVELRNEQQRIEVLRLEVCEKEKEAAIHEAQCLELQAETHGIAGQMNEIRVAMNTAEGAAITYEEDLDALLNFSAHFREECRIARAVDEAYMRDCEKTIAKMQGEKEEMRNQLQKRRTSMENVWVGREATARAECNGEKQKLSALLEEKLRQLHLEEEEEARLVQELCVVDAELAAEVEAAQAARDGAMLNLQRVKEAQDFVVAVEATSSAEYALVQEEIEAAKKELHAATQKMMEVRDKRVDMKSSLEARNLEAENMLFETKVEQVVRELLTKDIMKEFQDARKQDAEFGRRHAEQEEAFTKQRAAMECLLSQVQTSLQSMEMEVTNKAGQLAASEKAIAQLQDAL